MSTKQKPKVYRTDQTGIRQAILDRLEEFGASKYDLAEYSGVDMNRAAIYKFLSGATDAKASSVERLMAAVGLGICSVDDSVPAWAQK